MTSSDCIDLDLDNDGVDNVEDALTTTAMRGLTQTGMAWRMIWQEATAGIFTSVVDSLNEGGHYITVSNHYLHRESTVLCELGRTQSILSIIGRKIVSLSTLEQWTPHEYVSGEEYSQWVDRHTDGPNGLETVISPRRLLGQRS